MGKIKPAMKKLIGSIKLMLGARTPMDPNIIEDSLKDVALEARKEARKHKIWIEQIDEEKLAEKIESSGYLDYILGKSDSFQSVEIVDYIEAEIDQLRDMDIRGLKKEFENAKEKDPG